MSGTQPEALPAPVSGECLISTTPAGSIARFEAGPAGTRPLLLIHSVNAAASAYEMRPLFEHYRLQRRVIAPELPGFGHSERGDRRYSVRMMTEAVLASARKAVNESGQAIDAAALSLGCEFLARAAVEDPTLFRSLALISPTGLDSRPRRANADGNLGISWLRNTLQTPFLNRNLFALLTTRASIRFFLKKTFGSSQIDEGLLDYDYITTHQPGAQYAPYAFVSGFLFSADALDLYLRLTQPVWMSHGVRGDFVDYSRKDRVQGKPNWTIDVFQTGAMPHFEQPKQFIEAFDRFLADPGRH